ncbi:putative transcriptional regulator [Catalinimonas alkaloidigena]|uniref:YqgE/AlgH family protein n=1 Tax=Catalinimonas alkaloidigena TaxID=1075417 RepID=UPI002406EDF7|nr:YqgE/AlgH family protein [Catalinimonas alkaloidigena]MDF9796077.1 putative transcriptional regulator [Catalinimonas alkaloidigena]
MPSYIKPTKGDLLISEPFLPDPNFERSVILLCEHNKDGSLGFVLNKPIELHLSNVIEEVNGFEKVLHKGGPVQEDTLHFIHRMGEKLQGSQEIANGIYWGGDFEQLLSMINTKQLNPQDFIFFVGYSGWSPKQLEYELEDGSWIVYKQASPDDIFSSSPSGLWRDVLSNMGGKYRMLSNYPIDPRLN